MRVPARKPMDRNLAFELARATEAAALAAARWMGCGDRNGADQAAVDAMRFALRSVGMDGVIVIGEGEKDEAPMLFNGEQVGSGIPPKVDVAVDPIDGTTLLAKGQPNAISALAVAERGSMCNPVGVFYMDKIAVGRAAKGIIDITAPVEENVRNVAKAKGLEVEDVTVVILDRDRNRRIINAVRSLGARIRLLDHGDVAGAIMPAIDGTGIDILMGIGGAPEAILAACAIKCLGGDMQCRVWPRNEAEEARFFELGHDPGRVLKLDGLVQGDDAFFACTGVTDGELVKGVRYTPTGAKTWSLVMRSYSGTVRLIEAEHQFEKLSKVAGISYSGRRENASHQD